MIVVSYHDFTHYSTYCSTTLVQSLVPVPVLYTISSTPFTTVLCRSSCLCIVSWPGRVLHTMILASHMTMTKQFKNVLTGQLKSTTSKQVGSNLAQFAGDLTQEVVGGLLRTAASVRVPFQTTNVISRLGDNQESINQSLDTELSASMGCLTALTREQ